MLNRLILGLYQTELNIKTHGSSNKGAPSSGSVSVSTGGGMAHPRTFRRNEDYGGAAAVAAVLIVPPMVLLVARLPLVFMVVVVDCWWC